MTNPLPIIGQPDWGGPLNTFLAGTRQKSADFLSVKEDYGAVGDGVADDTAAFLNWRADLISTGKMGFIPAGKYRLTQGISFIDTLTPVAIHGAGARQTFLIGDFVNAGGAILEISNTNANSYSTAGHRVSGIGFLGRGTVGDPVAFRALNAFEHVVDDLDVPTGITWSGNSSGNPLANSAYVVTNDNNSKWTNLRSQAGWQPLAFDLAGATASFTSGGTTITASAAAFTSTMVGEKIFFASGSDTGSNAIWSATITAYTDSTHVVVDTPAPSTASGVKMSVGYVKGSITSGTNTLTLDNVVGMSTSYVGMQVHIIGADVKTDAASTQGVMSTTITAVGGNTLTLAQNATATVNHAQILFAPSTFIGTFEGDPSGRQTNHSWWINLHNEGFKAAGLLVNLAMFLTFTNLKIHGAAYSYSTSWAQCNHPAVFSEIKQTSINGCQMAYGIQGNRVHISGSRGLLTIRDMEIDYLEKNFEPFLIATASPEFRLDLGEVFLTYDLTNFNTDFQLVKNATSNKNLVLANGPVFPRVKAGTQTKTPAVITRAITGQHGQITLADQTVITFKPYSTFGMIHISSDAVGCSAILNFRTSDNANGVTMETLAAGANVTVLTSASTLMGSTGTSGKVNVACDASGNLQIENRRGFSIHVALLIGPVGG